MFSCDVYDSTRVSVQVSVVANQFVIRTIKVGSDDFMYSKNIFDVAERAGLWSREASGGVLDFTRTFSPPRMHSAYATRRVWRVFTLLDPDLALSPDTDNWASDYPFSVKPKQPLSQKDMMNLQRDHYEGSQFDLTKGLAAGPYGDPERFDPAPQEDLPQMTDVLQGAYERAISLFRTSYSIVCVSRGHLPEAVGALVWFAQYAPHTSTYSPFYLQSAEAPAAFTRGSLFKYDPSTSFWNFLTCGNWANRFYKFAHPVVKTVQDNLEGEYITESKILEQTVSDLLTICAKAGNCEANRVHEKVASLLTDFTLSKGQRTVQTYRDLFPQLIAQFHDGYSAIQLDQPVIKMTKMFYPKWWLEATGYFNNGPNQIADAILFEENPTSSGNYASAGEYYSDLLMWGVLVGAAALGVGFVAGKKVMQRTGGHHQYSPIDNHL